MTDLCWSFINKWYEQYGGTVILFKGHPCYLVADSYDLLQTYDDHIIMARASNARLILEDLQRKSNFPLDVVVSNHTDLINLMMKYIHIIL